MKPPYAKPDSMKKLHRNYLLVSYHHDHPELSLSKIAQIFNISKQRVHEIIQGYVANDQT